MKQIGRTKCWVLNKTIVNIKHFKNWIIQWKKKIMWNVKKTRVSNTWTIVDSLT